jgi:hypothetical protein
LLAPLSTSTVTSRRPTLRWLLADGSDGASVELCLDRPCANVLETIDVSGSTASPDVDLPAGTVFWRVRGRVGGELGDPSATWQLAVRARSAPLDRWWGTVLDVDGDGFADVAISDPDASNNYGRVVLFSGGAAGPGTTPATTLTGTDGPSYFGAAVASAGDVNGDGYADLIVGAPNYPGVPWQGPNAGRAYVFLGGPTGLSTSPTTLVAPSGDSGAFGASVAYAGDVNGDGYADVAISAVATGHDTGTVYVYLGGASGLATAPTIAIAGPDGPNARFGVAVSGVGDVDDDGYGDLAIGAPRWAGQPAGHVYLYTGLASGVALAPVAIAGSATAGDNFGSAIAADDFDGDGRADLAVGAPGETSQWGATYVFAGVASGFAPTPSITYPGPYESNAGQSVASAGDVDGDGYADLIVGLPSFMFSPPDFPIGAADIYLGSASGLGATPAVELALGLGNDSAFGISVAGAGDVDGDGHADVVVGAPLYANVGAAFLYLGAATLPETASLMWTGSGVGEAFGGVVQ